jgi:hypothetical protein
VTDSASPNRPLRLLILADPLLRMGLETGLDPLAGLQVLDSAEGNEANSPDVILWSPESALEGTAFRQQIHHLRQTYPAAPILLILSPAERHLLELAPRLEVQGAWIRQAELGSLHNAIEQVAAGESVWPSFPESGRPASASTLPLGVLQWFYLTGLEQIDVALERLNTEQLKAGYGWLDQQFMRGRQRELQAARRFLNFLYAGGQTPPLRAGPGRSPRPSSSTPLAWATPALAREGRTLQTLLWDQLAQRLESPLVNLTGHPLEIDVLRPDKKRELLAIVLRQLSELLTDLRFSELTADRLDSRAIQLRRDLWQESLTDFLGRYRLVRLQETAIELVPALLRSEPSVTPAFLDPIPGVAIVLAALLWQSPLELDGQSYPCNAPESLQRLTLLIENWAIATANAVMQPLLNQFGELDDIKQQLYDARLLSTREVTRFRNQLNWRYRLDWLIRDPQAMYESRLRLHTLGPQGIEEVFVYAARQRELHQLSSLQQSVTVAFELRDAISPQLRAMLAWVGGGLVYVLTQVIGRGLGLIGRGILQGVGSSFSNPQTHRSRLPHIRKS